MDRPDKFSKMYERVAELHRRLPEWRMTQFLLNVMSRLDGDPFYMENDAFLEAVGRVIDDIQGKAIEAKDSKKKGRK